MSKKDKDPGALRKELAQVKALAAEAIAPSGEVREAAIARLESEITGPGAADPGEGEDDEVG